jgi:hypothetical protein
MFITKYIEKISTKQFRIIAKHHKKHFKINTLLQKTLSQY